MGPQESIQVRSVGAYVRPRDQARAQEATGLCVPDFVSQRLTTVLGSLNISPPEAPASESASDCWLPKELDQLSEAA
jgi:hypothetical protein